MTTYQNLSDFEQSVIVGFLENFVSDPVDDLTFSDLPLVWLHLDGAARHHISA